MQKSTARIAGYEFEDEDVILDFSRFENCSFKNCKIIFHGQGPVELIQNTFDESCRYELAGPAAATVNYLRSVYSPTNMGGKELVETIFRQIRGE